MNISNHSIDHLQSGGAGSVGQTTGVGTDSRSSSGATKGAKADSVDLSSATSLIALAKASSASRQAKVQSIASDVRSGRYQSDTSQISHALVQGHIQG